MHYDHAHDIHISTTCRGPSWRPAHWMQHVQRSAAPGILAQGSAAIPTRYSWFCTDSPLNEQRYRLLAMRSMCAGPRPGGVPSSNGYAPPPPTPAPSFPGRSAHTQRGRRLVCLSHAWPVSGACVNFGWSAPWTIMLQFRASQH